jgi:hypothetical protein
MHLLNLKEHQCKESYMQACTQEEAYNNKYFMKGNNQ